MKRSAFVFVAFLFLLTLWGYAPVLTGFFVADDFSLIRGVQTGGPFGIWTIRGNFFRPVISASIYLDYRLWGLNPLGYRATNLIIHWINAGAVTLATFWLARLSAVKDRPARFVGMLAGVLFTVLPSHVEPVAWISGRTDVIATFFCLSTWLAYLAYLQQRRKLWLGIMILAFILALLSKEVSLAMLAILGMFALYLRFTRPGQPAGWLAVGLCLLLAPIYLVVRYLAMGGIVGGYGAAVHLKINADILLGGPPILLACIVFPSLKILPATWTLAEQIWLLRWVYWGVGCLGIGSLCGGAVWLWRRNRSLGNVRVLLFLLSASIFAMLPAMNLGIQIEARSGERLLYLPSVFGCGLLAMLAISLVEKLKTPRVGTILLCALVIVYGLVTRQACSEWRQAGEISASLLRSLPASDPSHPVWLVAPDNLRGALIFRNLPTPAAALRGVEGRWQTVASVNLDSSTDSLSIETIEGGSRLRTNQPRTSIIATHPPSDGVLVSADNRSVTIAVPPKVSLAYISQGKWVVIPSGSK